jgi:TolB protein
LPPADSWGPVISANGRYVAFVSYAADLVSGDGNRSPDVFLADAHLDSIELVSRSASRRSGNGASRAPAISADGRIVAFQSLASDLICLKCSTVLEDINLLSDVFVLDRATRRMTRVSGDAGGGWMEPSIGPALDASGTVVAYSSRHPSDAIDTQNDFDLFVVRR